MALRGSRSLFGLLLPLLASCSAPPTVIKPPPPQPSVAPPVPPSCGGADRLPLDRVSPESRVRIDARVASTLLDVRDQTKSQLLVVRVDNCSVTLLNECHAEGRYGLVTLAIDDTQTYGPGELRNELSDGSDVVLAQSSPAGVSASRRRHVRAVLGFDADPVNPWQSSLQGQCDGATHVVKNVSLGASRLDLTHSGGGSAGVVTLGNETDCEVSPAASSRDAQRSNLLGQDAAPGAPPPAPPPAAAAPEGCGTPLELQLQRITCPDSFSEWTGSRCALKELGPVLEKVGNAEATRVAEQLSNQPKSDEDQARQAQLLSQVIARLCGKQADSAALGASDCRDRKPAEYEAIALAGTRLAALPPTKDGRMTAAWAEGLFWKGTAYYAQGETAKALSAYAIVGGFAESPRAPAALLIFADKACGEGRSEQGGILYGQIARRFPKSPEGKRAQEWEKVADKRCTTPTRGLSPKPKE